MKKILIVLLLILPLMSCQNNKQENYTFFAMDTIISLSLYNPTDGKKIAEDVEDIYLKYDQVASDFTSGNVCNNVYDLNEHRSIEINSELKELIEFSVLMHKETDGYFNPFIGRLSHLWKDSLNSGKLLESSDIEEELIIMNNTSVVFDQNTATLIGAGNLDLGGIAKGYATQKAKEYLESINCTGFLLNAGSSNIVLGEKYGENFSVGLSKATDFGYFQILNIKNKSISTASISEQHYEIDGTIYSHLINAKTGYPSVLYDGISIIGDDSARLDAYSTACFSMEIEEIKAFLNNKGLDFIISKDNKLMYKSEGVDNYA